MSALTLNERRERGTELCRRLAADVAEVAPKGIGTWTGAWEIVADADAEFLMALSAWEGNPTTAALERARGAYHAVLSAWRRATNEYERHRLEPGR